MTETIIGTYRFGKRIFKEIFMHTYEKLLCSFRANLGEFCRRYAYELKSRLIYKVFGIKILIFNEKICEEWFDLRSIL